MPPRFGPPRRKSRSRPDPIIAKDRRSEPWWFKYDPANLQQLAMHSGKIKELAAAFENQNTRLVLFSGPAGSSKSTAVRLMIKEQQKQLIEWQAPANAVGETCLPDAFGDFLVGAAMRDLNSVVLIDEIPNLSHEDTQSQFVQALQFYLALPEAPLLVIVFTEIEVAASWREQLVVARVFPAILEHPKVQWIKANPISPTLLRKTLDAIASTELGAKAKSPAVVKAIKMLGEGGDVRSAIANFEIWASSVKDQGSKEKMPAAKDTRAGFFHAINRVIYGTEKETKIDIAQDYRDTLDKFNLTLLHNYDAAHHQRLSLEDAAACAEWMSIGDLSEFLSELVPSAVRETLDKSAPDVQAPKRFKQSEFTPLLKGSDRWDQYNKTLRYINSRRGQGDSLSFLEAVTQQSYTSKLRPPLANITFTDSSDSDSDW